MPTHKYEIIYNKTIMYTYYSRLEALKTQNFLKSLNIECEIVETKIGL